LFLRNLFYTSFYGISDIIMLSLKYPQFNLGFSWIIRLAIIMLSLKYPQFNLGFSWIIRLRCGYKYNITIAIRMGRVSEDCPCCGEDKQSFEHWIFKCDALASFRWNSLNFIDDLSMYYSLGRLECLIIFLPMTLFLILMIISIIIYTCSFLLEP